MSALTGRIDYAERLRRVTAYIHDHLDEPLDLSRLADVACLSAHHWHRVYHAVHGETVAATVKRLRLHRAAGYIAHGTMPIAEVARSSGYPNLQSFTRIFKSVYGMPPARYREQGSHVAFRAPPPAAPGPEHPVTIETWPTQHAIGVAHRGPYMGIGRGFEILLGRLATRADVPRPWRMLGLYFDDPAAMEPAALRSTACVAVEHGHPLADTVIRGGVYAVLRYRGPYASMHGAYRWLYGEWLVRSGYEAADAPVVEEYLNDPRSTPPAQLLTDIRLPLTHAQGNAGPPLFKDAPLVPSDVFK
ncbi:AraC family transcriptional regulator [Aquabacterium sp. A7-Y]|uniref:AraC family transcriptional regulator n=1 Tax=Aquabacterium sp. A7-Y TaxID=1349605 RepID=UPI00223CE1C0|nr:AraC family transcriptional regulator [Aquabacterium sp. A7-Y]MCW7538239.1 AraC family transcriptional regulator [Aquabacterium sp. A7-Y]